MFEFEENTSPAIIKVFGIGGGGCNAVDYMVEHGVQGVEFVCANTDSQVLGRAQAKTLQLGEHTTKGLGAGADPAQGREATLESREQIVAELEGANMVFIAAGMGGGTGTGGAPVVAEVAKELGILSVAVVTRPFDFEGRSRQKAADDGIAILGEQVDSLIVIANERLRELSDDKLSIREGFMRTNEVLHGAVRGIADLITQKGEVNVDFADVRAVMASGGTTIMGSGFASGEEGADTALEMAIHSPLLDNEGLGQAQGVLTNVTVGPEFELAKYGTINDRIAEIADTDAKIITGLVIDPDMQDNDVRVTVVAAGLSPPASRRLRTADDGADAAALRPVPSRGQLNGDCNYEDLDAPTFLRQQAD